MSAHLIPFPGHDPQKPRPVEASWTTREALLYVRTRVDGSGWTLELDGELDRSTVSVLESELQMAEGALAETITVDLRGLDFMDSSGISAIREARGRIRPSHRFRLIPGPRAVQKVFRMTGTEAEMPFVPAGPRSPGDRPPAA